MGGLDYQEPGNKCFLLIAPIKTHLAEVRELVFEQKTTSTLSMLNSDHGAVSSVGSSERVVNVDVSQLGQRLAESLDSGGISLDFRSRSIDSFSFLFQMVTKVLEEDDAPWGWVGTGSLNLSSDAVVEEDDISAKEECDVSKETGKFTCLTRSSAHQQLA